MFKRLLRGPAAIFVSSLIFLSLSAAAMPAAYADDGFYYLRPQPSFKIPEAPAPFAEERGSASGYLSQVQLQINDFPPPPAAGSAQDNADLAAVLQWQKDRTDAQCAEAKAQADESFTSFFGGVSPFPLPLAPEVDAFFKRAASDADNADRYIKNIYKRDRPFLRSAELNPCLGRAQGFSYPSGHAAISRVFGLILSDLLPRQGAIFMRAADQVALNRVIGGVHYPSDIQAGKDLGGMIYGELQKNPAFVSDMGALSKYFKH